MSKHNYLNPAGETDRKQMLQCFMSHKCDFGDSHNFGEMLSPIFAEVGLELMIDPFGPGENIGAKIRSIKHCALLFLACRSSWQSPYCREELQNSKIRRIPIFTVAFERDFKIEELDQRIWLDVSRIQEPRIPHELKQFASEIFNRAQVYYLIKKIQDQSNGAFALLQTAAQSLVDFPDTTTIKEFTTYICEVYCQIAHPSIRRSMLLTLEKSADKSAEQYLQTWNKSCGHPLEKKGIRDALKAIRNRSGLDS